MRGHTAQVMENEELVFLGVDNSSSNRSCRHGYRERKRHGGGKPSRNHPAACPLLRIVTGGYGSRALEESGSSGKGVLGGIYPNEVSQNI